MTSIDTSRWGQFTIKNIFDIKRPNTRSQANYAEGDIPFVASGNFNNGVLKYLQPKESEKLDSGNCISVSPIDGSSFYQEKDFLGRGGAGSSIILLYNSNLNKYNGCFIATIIRSVCKKYMYSDMANKDVIGSELISLPVTDSGNPEHFKRLRDWRLFQSNQYRQYSKSGHRRWLWFYPFCYCKRC